MRLVQRLIVATVLSLVGFAPPANATVRADDEVAANWARYLTAETEIEPDLDFPHAACFRQAALARGIPKTLLLAVARGESDFDAAARSRANAHGVMQIQWPETAKHLGIARLSALYDPCTNIDAGARYLHELLQRYDGNLHLTLAAYNYGPGRIAPGASTIPTGARWYSAYIYRHLGFVLGDRENSPMPRTLYSDVGKTVLLSFGEPYRAQAFVSRLEARAPGLSLDWFRRGVGEFEVVLSYADEDQFQADARRLSNAGFPLQ